VKAIPHLILIQTHNRHRILTAWIFPLIEIRKREFSMSPALLEPSKMQQINSINKISNETTFCLLATMMS